MQPTTTETVRNQFGEAITLHRDAEGRKACADCHETLERGFEGINWQGRVIGGCCFGRYLATVPR